MKLAKLSDFARGLRARTGKDVPCLTSFEFSDLPGFVDGKITVKATYAAVCGGTGVGKTAILELMYTSLTGLNHKSTPSPRLGNAKASIKFDHPEGKHENSIETSALVKNMAETNAYFIDVSERVSDAQRFMGDIDIEVLKEGIDSYDLDINLASLISLTCRKKFDYLRVYEIEGASDLITPYFEVKVGALTYDSRSMATGELSVIYMAWALHYIPSNSIIFIEEPEAYLPPVSHYAAYQLISTFSVIKKISFYISTHSPEIAATLSPSNLICIRTEGGSLLHRRRQRRRCEFYQD